VPPASDPLLRSPRWRVRLASVEAAAIAGIVCAAGWSIGLRGLLSAPSVDATDEKITRYYSDPDAGFNALVLLQAIVVATIAFLWFIGVVRSRLGDVEPRLFGTVFLGGGILMAGVLLAGSAALAAPSVLVEAGGKTPDPGAASMSRALAVTLLSVFAPRMATLVMFSTAAHLCRGSRRVRQRHDRPSDHLRVSGLDRASQRRLADPPTAPRIRRLGVPVVMERIWSP